MRRLPVILLFVVGLAACNLSGESNPPNVSPTVTTSTNSDAAPTEELACPVLIQQAIEAANQQCQAVDRNQTCYGNYSLQAESRSGAALPFAEPGDVVNLSEIKSLSLAAFDQTIPEWGVALMKVQADVPDTLPGQNVTVVLFGNVQIEDQSPDPNHPMQAFYFQSGIGNAPCAGVPGDGILIQTPQGVGEIHLTINEAQISLGSTAFVQAQPNDEMVISVVEGQAQVSAFDKTVIVPAGALTRTTLNANGVAAAPPADPEPFDASALTALPIEVLPERIQIAEPATLDELRPNTVAIMPPTATLAELRPITPELTLPAATFEERLVRAGWIGEGDQNGVGKLINAQIVFDFASSGKLTGTMTWTIPGEREQLISTLIAGEYYRNPAELPLERGGANPWANIRGAGDADVIAWLIWRNTQNLVGEVPQGSVFAFILKEEGEIRGIQYGGRSTPEKPNTTFTLFGFNFYDATTDP
jgi:hypothetical protein